MHVMFSENPLELETPCAKFVKLVLGVCYTAPNAEHSVRRLESILFLLAPCQVFEMNLSQLGSLGH